jgi:hypothetical protein
VISSWPYMMAPRSCVGRQIQSVRFVFVCALHKKEHPVLRVGWNPLGQLDDDEEVVVFPKEALSIADIAEDFR